MKKIFNIILSLILSFILVILSNNKLGTTSLLGVFILLALSLPLIWFGNYLGAVTGWRSTFSSVSEVNKKSSGSLVSMMGWIFLLIYFFFIITYQVY